jgi:hypothetical protein
MLSRASIVLFVITLLTIPARAAHYDQFVAGGQSNAKPDWSDAIASRLTASGRSANAEVVTSYQSGNWLGNWYDHPTTHVLRDPNYLADFYDPGSAQAALEARIAMIEAAGNRDDASEASSNRYAISRGVLSQICAGMDDVLTSRGKSVTRAG